MAQRTKEQAQRSANKNRNKTTKHLLICVVLRDPERRGNGRPGTYFLPVASHPCVMGALCSLARPSLGGTLANVAHIVSDPSGAFKSAVDLSVLNPNAAGCRALDKHTENTQEK